MILYLQKCEPSQGDASNQIWLKLAMWFWRRFSYFDTYVCFFVIISPCKKGVTLHLNNFIIISLWKRSWPFILTNLNSLCPRMPNEICPVLLEKKILNFLLFLHYLFFEQEAHGPHCSSENHLQSINTFAHDKIRPQCSLKEKKDIIFSFEN